MADQTWQQKLAQMLVNKGPSVAGSMNLDPKYQEHVINAQLNNEPVLSRPEWEAQYRASLQNASNVQQN